MLSACFHLWSPKVSSVFIVYTLHGWFHLSLGKNFQLQIHNSQVIFSQKFSLGLHISIINCLPDVSISMFDKIQNVTHWKLNSLLVPSFLLPLSLSVSQWMLPLDSKCNWMPPRVHPCPFPPSQWNHKFVPDFHPPPLDPWVLALVCLDWVKQL